MNGELQMWRVAIRKRLGGTSYVADYKRTVEDARQLAVVYGERLDGGSLPDAVQVVIEFDNDGEWQIHEVAWQRPGVEATS